MRMFDKVFASLVCVVFLCTGVVYLLNYDMYEKVEVYNPASGYAALGYCLQDTDWVTDTCDSWEDSPSPVLSSMYRYFTNASDFDPAELINGNRTLCTFTLWLSLLCWPVSIITSAVKAKPKEAAKYG